MEEHLRKVMSRDLSEEISSAIKLSMGHSVMTLNQMPVLQSAVCTYDGEDFVEVDFPTIKWIHISFMFSIFLFSEIIL